MSGRDIPPAEYEALVARDMAPPGAIQELPGGFAVRTVAPHVCQLPDLLETKYEYVPGEHHLPGVVLVYPEGSRYYCDCGQVYVVGWHSGSAGRYIYTVGHWAWFKETRRQRRKRLGYRWWQW